EPPRADPPPAPAQVAPPPAAAPGQQAEPWRVLVVEDDPGQALFAESVLNGAGMQAQVVSVTSEVMGALEQLRPDLVLMDLHMTDPDGAVLTSLIVERPEYATTPIVFQTGDADPARRFAAVDLGADEVLRTPVRPTHLVSTVQNRIARARALQS